MPLLAWMNPETYLSTLYPQPISRNSDRRKLCTLDGTGSVWMTKYFLDVAVGKYRQSTLKGVNPIIGCPDRPIRNMRCEQRGSPSERQELSITQT